MIVDTFIRRPILSSVCSLVIILAGALAIPTLPVSQYPQLAPPQVNVSAFYTGASAQVVETTVTTPLEQAINGVEGMVYMTSTSTNDGASQITVTFDVTRDPDLAAIDVQNRVSQAQSRLPAEVNAVGVTVQKSATGFILGAGVYAEDGEYDPLFLSNYLDVYVRDALKRIDGVANVVIFGERKYSMRLWLDPDRLAARQITAADVVSALRDQNVQVAAGQVGQQPARTGQTYQISVRAVGRLSSAQEFENVILKRGRDGALVRVRDIGRAELGAENYASALRYNGVEAVGVGVSQLPTANALDVRANVVAELDRLAERFPPGMKYRLAFDTTTVVSESIREVLRTLAEAIALVILVMFLFLQSWRTTLIPMITIPVSLVGAFAFVKAFDFSINTLTLFGIVLATGLVVDDAIVVIENIERHMREEKRKAREAASVAMGEVFSAVLATGLVLSAVFIPVAFFPGTTGRLYQQFALTIAFSMLLSVFNAVTLTPALAALLLREHRENWFFRIVNRIIDAGTALYLRVLRVLMRWRPAVVVGFLAMLGITYWVYTKVPTAFVPTEDQGLIIIGVQAPEGASLQYTSGIMRQVEQVLSQTPEVDGAFTVAGFSFGGSGSNRGLVFVRLRPFDDRPADAQSAQAVQRRLFGAFMAVPGAQIVPFLPPSIQGVGQFGGFQFQVLDQTGNPDIGPLEAATREMVAAGNQTPGLQGVFTQFTANDPQVLVTVDREKVKALGLQVSDITSTLQVFMGSVYVNDFDLGSRAYRVYVQADQPFRATPDDLRRFYTRGPGGRMIRLEDVVSVSQSTSPQIISHYNLFRSAEITGSAAPGFSSGEAIRLMDELAARVLPAGMGYEWSGLSREEIKAGGQAVLIFGLGLLLVYLTLAAQYESLSLPFIVMLSVPLAVLGALGAQSLRGFANDVYCQIGLLMLIGLAAKNGILVVEFAEQLRDKGLGVVDAAVEAARIRLRPILMTSLAFILGVMPLVFASGAGKAARHSVGTTVAGGMFVSTFLNLAIIPVLYVVVTLATERVWGRSTAGRR